MVGGVISISHVITDQPSPKYFCQYSTQPVSLLPDFWLDFLGGRGGRRGGGLHHQSIKTKTVSKDDFSFIQLVRTVSEPTFSMIQMHYKTTPLLHSDSLFFFFLTSAKVVLDQRPYFEKNVHTSILLANFRTNTVKHRQVCRSVIEVYLT